jgi:hypothetical protein
MNMITRYDDVPDNVAAFLASGEVTAADYESVLVPTVEEKLARHSKLRLLYQLGPDFNGFTAGAMWDDTKVGLQHLASWDRVAVVSDVPWIRHLVHALGFLIPAQVRLFHHEQLQDARLWVSEA